MGTSGVAMVVRWCCGFRQRAMLHSSCLDVFFSGSSFGSDGSSVLVEFSIDVSISFDCLRQPNKNKENAKTKM